VKAAPEAIISVSPNYYDFAYPKLPASQIGLNDAAPALLTRDRAALPADLPSLRRRALIRPELQESKPEDSKRPWESIERQRTSTVPIPVQRITDQVSATHSVAGRGLLLFSKPLGRHTDEPVEVRQAHRQGPSSDPARRWRRS